MQHILVQISGILAAGFLKRESNKNPLDTDCENVTVQCDFKGRPGEVAVCHKILSFQMNVKSLLTCTRMTLPHCKQWQNTMAESAYTSFCHGDGTGMWYWLSWYTLDDRDNLWGSCKDHLVSLLVSCLVMRALPLRPHANHWKSAHSLLLPLQSLGCYLDEIVLSTQTDCPLPALLSSKVPSRDKSRPGPLVDVMPISSLLIVFVSVSDSVTAWGIVGVCLRTRPGHTWASSAPRTLFMPCWSSELARILSISLSEAQTCSHAKANNVCLCFVKDFRNWNNLGTTAAWRASFVCEPWQEKSIFQIKTCVFSSSTMPSFLASTSLMEACGCKSSHSVSLAMTVTSLDITQMMRRPPTRSK